MRWKLKAGTAQCGKFSTTPHAESFAGICPFVPQIIHLNTLHQLQQVGLFSFFNKYSTTRHFLPWFVFRQRTASYSNCTTKIKNKKKIFKQTSQSYQRSVRKQFKIAKILFPYSQLSGSSSESEVMFTFLPEKTPLDLPLMSAQLIGAGHKEGINEVQINGAFWFSWGCCVQHEVFSGVSPGFCFVFRALVELEGIVQESWWFILVFKARITKESSQMAKIPQTAAGSQMEFWQVCTHTNV